MFGGNIIALLSFEMKFWEIKSEWFTIVYKKYISEIFDQIFKLCLKFIR